jgi:hypothetical protein
MRRSGPAAILLAAWAAVGGGCASSTAPRAAAVAAALEAADPGCDLSREEGLSLSRLELSALRALLRLAGDEEGEAAGILGSLERVEVASYRLDGGAACAAEPPIAAVAAELDRAGWWPMVVERDGVGGSWVFARGDAGGELAGLYVIALDGGALEVVRLEGRIDRLLAEAVRDDPATAARLVEGTR